MDENISVSLKYDHKAKKTTPASLLWSGNVYKTDKLDFHHTYKVGNTLYHVFSVSAKSDIGSLFFKLVFNTADLTWFVEDVYDPKSSQA